MRFIRKSWKCGAAAALLLGLAAGGALAQTGRPDSPIGNARNGPYTWNHVAIVGGGFVPGVVLHPAEPGLMYARTDMGGAYRWDAAAGRWIALTDWAGADDWNLLGIASIALDPTEPDRLYLATGTYTNGWSGNGAMLVSTNRGQMFRRYDLPFKLGANEDGRNSGERMGVNPFRPKELLLGTPKDGLWKSTDHGQSWAKVTSFPVTASTANGNGIVFVLYSPYTSGLVFAATSQAGGLFRSSDAGLSWQPVSGQPTDFLPVRAALSSNGILYVTYANAPGPNGVSNGAVRKLSLADGAWSNITPIGPWWATNLWYGFCGVTVDAQNPNTVMVSTLDRWWPGDTVYRSTNAGASWIGLRDEGDSAPWGHQWDNYAVRDSSLSPFLNFGGASAEFGHWIADVKIDPFNPNHVLYTTGATVWTSNDVTNVDSKQMTHWTVGANGIEQTAIGELISPPAGAHLLSAMGDIGGFRHDDFTVSPPAGMFRNPLMTSTTGIDFAGLNPAIVARVGWAGQHGGYSSDGGTTWTPFASEPAGASGNPGGIAVSADGSTFVWEPGSGAPAFAGIGGAWSVCAGAPANQRVGADRVNPHKFYSFDSAAGTVYVSVDGAATFTAAATGLPAQSGVIRATPGREGDLWLALSDGLYHSTDSGATFVNAGTVQHATAIGFGMHAPESDYPALFLTGQVNGLNGVYRSDNAGASWVRINDDAHQYGWVGVITGDPRIFGRVYLGTNGRGIVYGDIR